MLSSKHAAGVAANERAIAIKETSTARDTNDFLRQNIRNLENKLDKAIKEIERHKIEIGSVNEENHKTMKVNVEQKITID
jgi:hypothetical protein